MSEVCTQCGLPKELCVCETIAKESQTIRVYIIKKKFGKKYTVIEGLQDKQINLKELTKKLKTTFACGGSGKEGHIELQGDYINTHRDNVKFKGVLVGLGFDPTTIEIK